MKRNNLRTRPIARDRSESGRPAARVRGCMLALGMLIACPLLAHAAGPASADDWPNFGRDGSEQHYSPLADISGQNIDKLRLAWHFDLEPGFTVSTPVAAEGKLFTTTGHSRIRALDATSGKLLWEYDARTREIASSSLHMSWGNKGLAYWNGRVFIATTDGRVIALDAGTGKPVWEQRQYELSDLRNSNGAPRVFDGKVIIGHGGADLSPIRGYVTAYDAMTGKQLWRFYAVPGDPAMPATNRAEAVMRPTWKGDWYGKGGGGTAWNAFSYDAELGLVYLGIGNGYPYNQQLRSPGGGDNLFLASIVAVKADTGEYVWHYQVCPAEQWDCTAVQDMTLATLSIDGKPRKVLMQAPKNGFFYVLDAATGQFISAEKFAKVTWAERIDAATGRPVENPGIRYQDKTSLFEMWPGPQGAHSWLPQAFSPRTNLVYIPVMDLGALIGPPSGAKDFTAGMGVTLIPDVELPDSRRSYLRAWDPIAQQAAWSQDLPGDWPGGVLATAGDLVFQGRIDGQFVAYDAKSGKQVWSFKADAPIVAAPISYRVNGRQYVTVLTGSGSQGGGILATGNAAFRTDYRLPRHVLTFAIGGTDQLPPYQPPALVTPKDPDFQLVPDQVTAGAMAYAMGACLVCHGMNAIGGGAAPDLRYSPLIVNAQAFKAVVKDGALKLNGMPAAAQLSDEQTESIRYYLRAVAQQTAAGIAPASPPPPSGGT
jgi:quinohemoprotein ethanol dehydrogenase